MHAILTEGHGHRPLIRFDDGRVSLPVNLHFWSRHGFLSVRGRQVEVVSRLADLHDTVRLPGAPEYLRSHSATEETAGKMSALHPLHAHA